MLRVSPRNVGALYGKSVRTFREATSGNGSHRRSQPDARCRSLHEKHTQVCRGWHGGYASTGYIGISRSEAENYLYDGVVQMALVKTKAKAFHKQRIEKEEQLRE